LADKISSVIDIVKPYVTNSIWLGKMNSMKSRLEINTEITNELKEKANQLFAWQSDDNFKALYDIYKNDSLIRWKAEIKTIVGIAIGAMGSDE